MNRIPAYTAALAAAVVLFSGCDFFRKVAGRPTSADIAAMRDSLVAAAGSETAQVSATVATAEIPAVDIPAPVDTVALADSLRAATGIRVEHRSLSAKTLAGLGSRYYVMIGSFGHPANADKLAARARNAGYQAVLVQMPNGHTAVGVCPSATVPDVYAACEDLKKEKFCPSGIWILDTAR